MLAGQAVMINWSDVAPEHRGAYYEWHNREHMVGRVGLSGFHRGRRYVAVEARRDFLILYEIRGVDVLASDEYLKKANAPSELTRRTSPFIKNAIRGLTDVKSSFGIGVGGAALTIRFSPTSGNEADAAGYLDQVALPRLAQWPEVTGAHRLVTDRVASGVVTVERRGRPTGVPDWVVVVEAVDIEALKSVCRDLLAEERLVDHGAAPSAIEYDFYRLQVMVAK